mgnify:CR=1 FL=1
MNKKNEGARYSRDFKIRSYEVGAGNRIKILTYLNYLQETAGDHAELLGVGFTRLLENNRTWILAHYGLEILGYPSWKDEVRVTTWPSGREKPIFYGSLRSPEGMGKRCSGAPAPGSCSI